MIYVQEKPKRTTTNNSQRRKRNHKLDKDFQRENDLYQRKQAAYEKYILRKKQADAAYCEQGRLQKLYKDLGEKKEAEKERLIPLQKEHAKAWRPYEELRDYYGQCIAVMKQGADNAHRAMQDNFQQSRTAYQNGDHQAAGELSDNGYACRDYRDVTSAEIKDLAKKLKEIKKNLEKESPPVDWSKYHQLKEQHSQVVKEYTAAKQYYEECRKARDAAKKDFDDLHASHQAAINARKQKQKQPKNLSGGQAESAITSNNIPKKYNLQIVIPDFLRNGSEY